MLLALLVFAFAEYFREPFGPGLSSMSNISFRKGRNVDTELRYKSQVRRILLTIDFTTKLLVSHVVVG